MSGTFSLTPDAIVDDPYYFEDHERLKIALYTFRHTMKGDGTLAVGGETFDLAKGQIVTAAQRLADTLKVTRDKVLRVWKRMEKAVLILLKTLPSLAHNRSAPRTMITVCCQTKNGSCEEVFETDCRTRFRTQSAHNPHSYKDKNLESKKEDSCQPSADQSPDYDPFADDAPRAESMGAGHSRVQPQPQPQPEPKAEAAGAGPSDVPPQPEPKAEAGSPPNSAAPPSRKPARKMRVPEDWTPKPQTHAWALNGTIGAKPEQIAEQLEAFRDHHISKGSTFVDFDRAFQTWMRNSKRFGQLDAPRPKFKTKAEEYCI